MAGLSFDDPVYLEMKAIVSSAEGRAAALESAKAGKPALCGVDKLLQLKLGSQYRVEDTGTKCAGDLVAKLMHAEGYRRRPRRPCDPGCLAKTGILWVAP